MPRAPEKLAQWMAAHEHRDKKYKWVYQYHPRSDAHSVALCEFILEDLLASCDKLREHVAAGKVVCGVNYEHILPITGKTKTLDLVIGAGTPETTLRSIAGISQGTISTLLLSCESKATMTEHSKSQPRVFDELSSSHEIIHSGAGPQTIAAGITVVNIAHTFVSPLRQRSKTLRVTKHKQPQAAEKMIKHLRGLPIRDQVDKLGFDAYATVVINCDNQKPATSHTDPPAPQPGEPDEYGTFITRLAKAYADRFGSLGE